MRVLAAFLLLLFTGKCVWADVVVSNIGLTSTSALMPTGNTTTTFTPTQTGTFGTLFTIKVKNQTGATGDLAVLKLNFSGEIGYRSGTLIGGTGIAPGDYGEFQYNLGNISYTSGVAKTFTFAISMWSNDTIIHWATAGSGTYAGAWGSGATASIPNAMYSVSVPESGTLTLGTILAMGSGAFFWWNRKKRAGNNV